MDDQVEVILDSPNGPKAYFPAGMSIEDALAALPAGWTVHPDDWANGVKRTDGRWAYPLSKSKANNEPQRT